MQDEELMLTFIEETQENLQILEETLLDLETSPDNKKLIDTIFRAMHNIKGGAGLVGQQQINIIAHHLENLLEKIRQYGKVYEKEFFALLFKGVDLLKQIINSRDFLEDSFSEEVSDLVSSIQLYEKETGALYDNSIPKNTKKKSRYYEVRLKFKEDIFESGTDPLMLIIELQEKGIILDSYLNYKTLPDFSELDPFKMFLSWIIFLKSESTKEEIEDIFLFVKEDNEIYIKEINSSSNYLFESVAQITERLVNDKFVHQTDRDKFSEKVRKFIKTIKEDSTVLQINKQIMTNIDAKKVLNSDTIRVESGKLESILNGIAELLIAQSRVKELVASIKIEDRSLKSDLITAFQKSDKMIRTIQEDVLSTSMIPIRSTFINLKRMVRDMINKANKKAEIEIEGVDTELDKKVIERIADPLKHLIRNSIDHGLELPLEREKLGKPPTGLIRLKAYHQQGNIIIEVSDDGRGINEEEVLEKAKAMGLIDQNRLVKRQELFNFLFKSGFSTATKISETSGRGVGLDVVQANIQDMRGSIEVFSQKNRGTQFKIKLPLTLAIIDGMMIRVGEERFVIPLTSVIEFIKAKPENIKTIEGKGIVVKVRDEYIPCFFLYKLFKLNPECKKTTDGILIILKDGRKKIALLVDEIVGQEQVVIKNVCENMGYAEGVAGATILGDGKVSLILDIYSIFKLIQN